MAKKQYIPKTKWWHSDNQGRYIGYMWPEDFLAVLEGIWGPRKGIRGFARYTDHSFATVESWANGSQPIPAHIALLIGYMEKDLFERLPKDKPSVRRPSLYLLDIEADWINRNAKNKMACRNVFGPKER